VSHFYGLSPIVQEVLENKHRYDRKPKTASCRCPYTKCNRPVCVISLREAGIEEQEMRRPPPKDGARDTLIPVIREVLSQHGEGTTRFIAEEVGCSPEQARVALYAMPDVSKTGPTRDRSIVWRLSRA